MPELPEVEALRRHLVELTGGIIRTVEGRDPMVYAGELTPDRLEGRLVERRLERVGRRGKYLHMAFDRNRLLFSLRMTGRFALGELPPGSRDHRKLSLFFEEAPPLHFLSVRRLSRIHWLRPGSAAWEEKVGDLGPDPLRDEFTPRRLREQLEGRRGPLKPLLMDQGFVAGLGNIYASELCHRLAVDPRRRAPDLRPETVRDLPARTTDLMHEAVATGGTSFRDFRNPDGRSGRYQRYHRVYDRAGEHCVRCGGTVSRIEQAGRATFFCPDCQT